MWRHQCNMTIIARVTSLSAIFYWYCAVADCGNRAISCCGEATDSASLRGDFLLLIDVNEWINNECAECALHHPNIREWFTRSHPSKGENRTRNRSQIRKCKRAFKFEASQMRRLFEGGAQTSKYGNAMKSSWLLISYCRWCLQTWTSRNVWKVR
jgi:hypothetical protein